MTIVLAMIYFLIFLIFTCFIAFNLTPISVAAIPIKSRRLIIELIHRDSIHSPFHNQRDNLTTRVQRAMRSSIKRFDYLQSKIKSACKDNDYEADVLPSIDSSLFYMNFSIGQPSIPQFTVMDTGSSLLWVQCHPCINCSQQFGPMFDPSKSSSYANLSCNSQYCRFFPVGKCDSFFDQCAYNQTFVHGPASAGVLATEQLVFKTSDEGTIVVPNVVFGCGHDNGNFSDRQLTGVFGLGLSRLSLVSQLGYGFSYCIGNLYDPYYIHNKLILGHNAKIEGDSTPLELINGRYYVTLQGISVGDKELDIDRNVFKRRKWSNDGVIFDTGSPATWLVKDGFEALRDEVQSLLDMWLTRYWYNSWTLCYEGSASRDLIGFPTVTFHFAEGAELALDTDSLFLQAWPNVFCMAVFPSFANGENYTSLSLIGMMAQQNYNVAYDIGGKKLTLQRIDCELLDD